MRSGLRPHEQLEQARVLSPTAESVGGAPTDERVGGQPYVVEGELELLLRRVEFHVDLAALEARGVARDDEQAGLQAARAGILSAADDEGGLGDVHTGDEHLAAGEEPVAGGGVAAGGRRDAVGVGGRRRVR